MLTMSENEIIKADEQLNPKIQWAEENKELAEQLAMDATRLMSCTTERLDEYKDKGFFKRCVASFSGKTAKMQRDNQDDLIHMQKISWRYLQMLNERDILMAHSLITIKNNLETLAINETETREEIARFAVKVKQRFSDLSRRVDELEVAVDIHNWLITIEVQEYDELYPPNMRLLCLVRDFSKRKADDWNMKNIQCLQQAISNAKLDRKKKISIKEFVTSLIDEIEEHSFDMFDNITVIKTKTKKKVETTFLIEEISSPVFNSLHQISDNYNTSNTAVETLKDDLTIEEKEAIKKIILGFIKKSGVDIEKEIQLQDLALEILSCNKLAQELYDNNIQEQTSQKLVDDNTQIDIPKIIADIKTEEKINEIKKNTDLQLSLMSSKIGIGSDFGILIDKNGILKSFGRNGSTGVLGIGSNEYKTYETPINVIDIPSKIACISVSVGYKHTLALFEDGTVYAWGDSNNGQLGDDTRDERLTPFKTIGLPKNIMPIKIIAGAKSSLVLLENGEIYATGYITDSLTFVPYPLDLKIKDIELLYDTSDNALALLTVNNKIFIKKFGDSKLDWCEHDTDSFVQIKGIHPEDIVIKIVAGSAALYALAEDNILYSVGNNKDGELGNGEYSNYPEKSFSKIYGLEGEVKNIVATHERYSSYSEDEKHFVLTFTSKALYGWGSNKYHQLGKQENCYTTYYDAGIIFKDWQSTEHYYENKPKIIKDLNKNIISNHKIEFACGNNSSYMYDYTASKLYQLGNSWAVSWKHVDVEIFEI